MHPRFLDSLEVRVEGVFRLKRITMEVPEDIKLRATQCQQEFGCLEKGYCGHDKKCEVKFAFGPSALGLKFKGSLSCPYRESFGDLPLCTCPVRYFLYTKNPSIAG